MMEIKVMRKMKRSPSMKVRARKIMMGIPVKMKRELPSVKNTKGNNRRKTMIRKRKKIDGLILKKYFYTNDLKFLKSNVITIFSVIHCFYIFRFMLLSVFLISNS